MRQYCLIASGGGVSCQTPKLYACSFVHSSIWYWLYLLPNLYVYLYLLPDCRGRRVSCQTLKLYARSFVNSSILVLIVFVWASLHLLLSSQKQTQKVKKCVSYIITFSVILGNSSKYNYKEKDSRKVLLSRVGELKLLPGQLPLFPPSWVAMGKLKLQVLPLEISHV